MTCGSLPRNCLQKLWLTITAWTGPGASSAAVNGRPSAGVTPSNGRRFHVDCLASILVASPRPETVNVAAREAAMSSNDDSRAFQSRRFGQESDIRFPRAVVSAIHISRSELA